MMAAGRLEEARAAASECLEAEEESELVVEAHQCLENAAFEELRRFVETHPRWDEDDQHRAARDLLYHKALDYFLFPSLFHGSRVEQAAQGLWQAVEVCRHGGDREAARAMAEDLVVLYPRSAESRPAKRFLTESSSPSEKSP